MTPLAIALMLVAMLILWGGLALAITFLARNPLEPEDDDGGRDPGPGGRRASVPPHAP